MPYPKPTLAIAGAALLLTASCRPELVVHLTTRVYHDGSVERTVDVSGRREDGKPPDKKDWLASKLGLELADRQAWGRIEESAGRLHAEGFFTSVEQLPPTLAFGTDRGARRDRIRTTLEIDERVVMRRWVYRERHADLYSATEVAQALDNLLELAIEALRAETTRQFGAIDTERAETLLRGEGRSLFAGLLGVERRQPGFERLDERIGLWSQVLAQHGIETAAVPAEPTEYWGAQTPRVIEWSKRRLAEALSTPEQTIRPTELSFLPSGDDDLEDRIDAILARTWGDTDAFLERAKPYLDTLSGYYGGDNAPRLRFEVRVTLPGELLRTDGTPDGTAALWLLREEDLSFGERTLHIESVELQDEALRALGARRGLDSADLIRLADLLWNRDPEGSLVELLRRAVADARLDVLRSDDEDEIPPELQATARELADLLEP